MIVEKNIQIQKMEAEIEILIKKRELQISARVGTSTTTVSAIETVSTSQNPIEQLSKAMRDLSLKDMEIEKLKIQVEKSQDNKIKVDNAYLVEVKRKFRSIKQLDRYENELVIAQTLSEAKEKIWIDINSTMTELQTSIQIIFEQEELVERSKAIITGIIEDLEHIPGEANKIIKVLNSKTKRIRRIWN